MLSYLKRIAGEGFLLFSGRGIGSFGLLLSFLVIVGFTSMKSAANKQRFIYENHFEPYTMIIMHPYETVERFLIYCDRLAW